MLLSVDGLTIEAGGRRPILREVSLTVGKGEIVGLVGESGSGKSTIARSVLRLLPSGARVSGRVAVSGDDVLTMSPAALRDLRASQVAMIYQDPRSSLNPVRRIGDFLTERMVLTLGRPKAEARARALDLLAAVGMRDPELRMRQYPHELSGGMLQRVVIAAALAADPALLLADEATSALDVTTQAETLALLRRVQAERELGMLFITHDLHLAAAFCDRVHVLYAGTVVESRPAKELFEDPRHPYTAGLLACTPELGDPRPLRPIPGRPPSLDDAFAGCPFAPRCPSVAAGCDTWVPEPVPVPGGSAACRLVEA
ncbi:oligopeptide/dipeptide ABC transporter, ATP-binding protein, C-terminal domain-containing protein [Nonomuraea solani]|uniref:Oligopeptide/dipeptide ABC transporter, ATP-binding protein, C-terminal domain-containing protein n=1 Tax=Nonomuraea solani TaxID=1144553 RepID=A0A1H6ET26_9ACTN|nr:ABC transporter ATP-binding protein [Nonomuraea solani]SEH00553.1 oligopeptide/dipeptide ABC transporter, ATP-binding protein, C-terminal domain-containing protein [Nonomuraea solani]